MNVLLYRLGRVRQVQQMRFSTSRFFTTMRASKTTGDSDSAHRGAPTVECDVCVVGSGPSAQAAARSAARGGRSVLILEAGHIGETNRRLQHAIAAVSGPAGSIAPDPSGQVAFRVGGSLNLPSIALSAEPDAESRTGVRLARLADGDFAPRNGGQAWPLGLADLEGPYQQAEAAFGLPASATRLSHEQPRDSVPFYPFVIVDRQPVADGRFRVGNDRISVMTDAAVGRLSIDDNGTVVSALVRRSDGSALDVRASDFVLACGTYSTTRILLESAWDGGIHAANSSGLLGVGLTDHPQIHLGVARLDSQRRWDDFAALAPEQREGYARWDSLVALPTTDRVGLAAIVLPQTSNRQRTEPANLQSGLRAAQTFADGMREQPFTASTLLAAGNVARHSPRIVQMKLEDRARRAERWTMEYGWWGNLAGAERPPCFSVFALAEQQTHEANRVELSSEETDVGWKRLRISWDWSTADRRRTAAAGEALLDAVGMLAGHVDATPADRHVHKFSSHHPSGTTRMSLAASDGVVNQVGRTHDHGNLWVVGASTFPSGGFVNPTLTAMALGYRTGDALADART